MKRIVGVITLLIISGCGSQQTALQASIDEVWQVKAAQNAGSFGLLIANGMIVGLQDEGGERDLGTPVAWTGGQDQLTVAIHLDADVFGHGATQPTDIIVIGQKQADGSYVGVVSIDTDDGPGVEFVKECTVKQLS